MRQVYRATAGRIRTELQELARVAERATRIWQQAIVSSDDYYVDATALNLHGFYAGIERVLEVIADGIDRVKPSGPRWHQGLLRQMAAEIPSVRPSVLSLETRDRLDRYRGFRHVVRNVYTFNFDVGQIEVLIKQLPSTLEQVSRDLLGFADFLAQLAEGD